MITQKDLEDMGYAYYSPDPVDQHNPLGMVREFARITQQLSKPSLYATLIQEEFEEWHSEYLHNSTTAQLKELADLVYVIYGYANAKGWDLTEALLRVHNNNVNRCIQPDGSIKYRADGKVMKNPDYPKPNLSDLV